ncbi:DUF1904 domain-containing protein [Paenibacillus sp. P26]|nr:DUF1904 domain-containing protein [Paenibacillus sp. P26]UUZ89713.1 DUF1904 domain-containing protein [Paenibacillus sp. P25]
MPQLTFKGIPVQDVCALSGPLVRELAEICSCGTDNFTLDCLHTTAVWEGKEVPSYPFVEVAWFERGTETRDRMAEAITRRILGLGVQEVEVAFRTYREDSYYINGKSCG